MFSTHRPKIYRSRLGCCVCGAKSSSSRFTSSTKYEEHFEGCFVLGEKRQGEICNACVLLVKRWSKLPQGSTKNWKHVVDSKASVKRTIRTRRSAKSAVSQNGSPKSMELEDLDSTSVTKDASIDPMMDANDIEDESDCPSPPSLACVSPSPPPSDISDECSSGSFTSQEKSTKSTSSAACQTSFLYPSLKSSTFNKLPYIDLSLWRQEEICCGMIFRGPYGEVLVDPKLLNPLCTCSTSQQKVNGYVPTKNGCKIPT